MAHYSIVMSPISKNKNNLTRKSLKNSCIVNLCLVLTFQLLQQLNGIIFWFDDQLYRYKFTQPTIAHSEVEWKDINKLPKKPPDVQKGYGAKYAISAGGRNHDLSLHNGGNEPFWLEPTQGFIRSVKSLFAFLAEQPSQLKYIEWPGFQNTVKTATLTLVLVALLIVVLSSVESGLWYLVALILRKPA